MTITTFARLACAAAAASLCVASVPAAALVAAAPFTGLVVFGDSLSDNGNLFAAAGYPGFPYFQGRFSNGVVAVEHLATGLGLNNALQFRDLAIAGATTGTGGQLPNTGMLNQLAGFSAALGGNPADSGALYTVWGGANDLRAAAAGGPAAVGAAIAAAIGNLTSIVSTLHGLGAHNFLLPNLPDLGLKPEAINANRAAQATLASETFNTQLALAYSGLAAAWADEKFYFFDVMQAQRTLVGGAPGNGFTDVSHSCLATAGCNPATFVYWDNIHPTAITHQILGAQMLAAVPEPQTVLLMAAGVLVLLGAARRRR